MARRAVASASAGLLALLLAAAPARSTMNAGLEAVASSSTALTADFGPGRAIDGDNETEWVSGVQSRAAFGPRTEEVFELDLSGSYRVHRVEMMWAKSKTEGFLNPSNMSVEVSPDGSGFTHIAQVDDGAVSGTAVFTPAGSSSSGGAGATENRYIKLRMWDESSAGVYFGIVEIAVIADDAPLTLGGPLNGTWLSAGQTTEIRWVPVPQTPEITIEFLRSAEDRSPLVIAAAADQTTGLFSWAVPPLSLHAPTSLALGSNYFLRLSRPQGLLGRRVYAVEGPLVLAGNMAIGGVAGATSWNSLSAEPSMAIDGHDASAWSNECDTAFPCCSAACDAAFPCCSTACNTAFP